MAEDFATKLQGLLQTQPLQTPSPPMALLACETSVEFVTEQERGYLNVVDGALQAVSGGDSGPNLRITFRFTTAGKDADGYFSSPALKAGATMGGGSS
jgi:hypothetical protein